MKFASGFRCSLVECEIYRNGQLVNTVDGLVNDNETYNTISFDPDTDIQVNDDIFCPLKNKHYIITNTNTVLFGGKPYKLDAYFKNNFSSKTNSTIFNTYNPTNSIIGNQQNVTISINESFNNLDKLINNNGGEDITRLNELSSTLKSELSGNQISKTKLSKFSDLIAKHSWLPIAISQIIAGWIQQG